MGDFIGWLTGHDEKEQSVYKNEDKVNEVVDSLEKISNEGVNQAKSQIYEALNEINEVPGFTDYVNTINVNAYDEVFESISSTILQASEMVKSKADAIKEYNDASWLGKIGSTFAMTGAKLGEGLLSVLEDIGDGALSIVGWVAAGAGYEGDVISNLVKKDLAHDAFSGFYDSDFAKKSLYTEDSAIAGGVKIVGSTAGYLALGGIISGASGVGVKSSSGVLKSLRTAATSTTKVNTFTAALTGMGSGTESGLQSGLSMKEAGFKGAQQAVEQGFFAYIGGKLGEANTKKQFAKEFEGTGSDSTKFMSKTAAKAEVEASSSITASGKKQIMNDIDNMAGSTITRRRVANEILNNKELKLNNFQGYTDAVTRWGQNTGSSIAQNGLITTVSGGLSSVGTKLNSAKNTFQTAIQEPGKTLTNAVDGIKGSVKNLEGKTNMLAYDLQYNPTQVLSNVAKTSVQTIGQNAPTIAATLDSTLREQLDRKGTEQFRITQVTDQLDVDVSKDKALTGARQNADETFKSNNTSTENTSSNDQGDKQKKNQDKGSGNPQTSSSNPESSQTQFRQTSSTSTVDPTTSNTSPSPTTTKEPTTSNTNPSSSTTKEPTTSNTNQSSSTTKEPTSTNTTTSNITTPPSNGNGTSTAPTTTVHTGGGYSGSRGYTTGSNASNGDALAGTSDTGTDSSITGTLTEGTTSIEDVIKGSKVTKIPTSPSPVTTTSSSSGSSAVIPIAAGLSAAAAAGIGAKAYMDRKHNNDNGEDDEDEFDTDEWSGDDSVDIQYDEDTANGENYLDDDDDYSYQATSNNEEKYDARSSEELADLQ